MALDKAPGGGKPKKKQNQWKYTTTPLLRLYIRRLRATGLFGTSNAEVAARLVSMSIQQLLREPIIKKEDAPPPPDEDADEDEDEG